jgi:hypothetical protein
VALEISLDLYYGEAAIMQPGLTKGGKSMPWRKYESKQGKYGPVYNIATGVSVRRDACAKWTLFVESANTRMNRTIGCGRQALVKAIRAGEEIASNLSRIESTNKMDDQAEVAKVVGFNDFSEQWFEANCKRWEPFTAQRYEEILRLYIWPADNFSKPIDKISRKEIKQHLRSVY